MIKIAKAKIGDNKGIRDLEKKIWKEFRIDDAATNKYDIGSFIRFGYVFVAKVKSKIVGAIIAIRTNNNSIFIIDWIVDKNFREQGIGSALYKDLMRHTKGDSLITLVSQRYKASVKAHKNMGFKLIRMIKDPHGVGEKEKYFFFLKNN